MAHGSYHAIRTAHRHRHRFVLALSFLIPFLTYAFSVSHSVGSRDVAEMQGVPYLLGIPHATGYPLFVLLGWLFSHVVALGSLAFRMNLFGAVCMGLVCSVGAATAIRIGVGPVTSLGAMLCFAWTRIIWLHGAQADTQDLALLFQALTIYFLCGWLIDSRTGDIVCAAAAFGAAIAVQPISLWLVPAFGFAKVARLRRFTFANAGAALMAFVLLLCCYAYLPLRAGTIEHAPADPLQMLAPPSARVYWDANAPSTRSGFVTEVTGTQFGFVPLWRSAINPQHWLSFLSGIYTTLRSSYDLVFVVVAALGVILLLQRRSSVCVMLLLVAVCSAVAAFALAPVEGDPSRYLMLLLYVGALFAGGITAEFTWTVDPRRMVWALVLLINAIVLAVHSGSVAVQQRNVSGRPLLNWVAANVPEHSFLVAPWFDATTLAYAAYADGTLPGRTIVAARPRELLSDYPAWSRREPVYVLAPAPVHDARLRQIGTPQLGRTIYRFVQP